MATKNINSIKCIYIILPLNITTSIIAVLSKFHTSQIFNHPKAIQTTL